MVCTYCQCNMIASLTYGVNSTSNIGILAQRLHLFRRFPLLCLHSTKQPPCIFIIDWARIIIFHNMLPKLAIAVEVKFGLHRGTRTHQHISAPTLSTHTLNSLTSPLAPLISTHSAIWANVRNQNIVMTSRISVPNFCKRVRDNLERLVPCWLTALTQGAYPGGSHSYTWNYWSEDGAKVLRQKTDILSHQSAVLTWKRLHKLPRIALKRKTYQLRQRITPSPVQIWSVVRWNQTTRQPNQQVSVAMR